MGIKMVLVTRQPAEVAAFWDNLSGDVSPPCRLHPEYWLVRSGGMAIMDASDLEPGLYVNVSSEHAEGWSGRRPRDCVDRDVGGGITAVRTPDGQRLRLIDVPQIPRNVGEKDSYEIVQEVSARRADIVKAMALAGVTNGRLIGPRNLARDKQRLADAYRLVVDGDGDLAAVNAVLADVRYRQSKVTAMRAQDVPGDVRDAVDRLALYLADDGVWTDGPWW